MCGHREDAEEVVQETLLRVFENFGQLREPEHVRAWVFRIAKNAFLMKRRKSIYAPQQELSLDELMPARGNGGDPVKIEIADWSAIPENETLRSELQRVLDAAVAEMPEIYRSVMLLRDVEELSTEETAQVLDLSTDAVKDKAAPRPTARAQDARQLSSSDRGEELMPTHQHDENCRKMFAQLSEYLDMELPSDACQEIEAHMSGCEPCAAFTESLRKTIELCREYQPKELPGPMARDAKAEVTGGIREDARRTEILTDFPKREL